jgi:hypothetical protein
VVQKGKPPRVGDGWAARKGPVLTEMQRQHSRQSTTAMHITKSGGTPASSSIPTGHRATPWSTPRPPSPSWRIWRDLGF